MQSWKNYDKMYEEVNDKGSNIKWPAKIIWCAFRKCGLLEASLQIEKKKHLLKNANTTHQQSEILNKSILWQIFFFWTKMQKKLLIVKKFT